MAGPSELTTLHRTIDELRTIVSSIRGRYGDIPAVRRLIGDIERIELDASELADLDPMVPSAAPFEVLLLDDTPQDRSFWADADDEGLGGYHR